MHKRNKYRLPVISLAAIAAGLALLALSSQFEMREIPFALAAEAAPRPQIPVQIPEKKKPGQSKEIPQIGGRKKINVNLVRLYVTVRDKHGAVVPNLEQKDFHVFEDGKEQKISFFSKDMNDPITLAMMVDTSGSEQDLLSAEKETASRFLRDILKKDDLATVISFDTTVNMLADFTDDQDTLQKAIDKAEINAPVALGPSSTPLPGTVLYDAINQVCADKLPTETGRKALIILTDAEDEGSTSTLKSAIYAAQQANAVIHVLLIADTGGFFMRGAMYSGGSVAHDMAYQTGGRVISVRNDNDLDKAFNQISQELRSQYIVAYYPTDTSANGGFRKIKVDTEQKDLKVLTRAGYYAPTTNGE
jgi:VWFA-related protein